MPRKPAAKMTRSEIIGSEAKRLGMRVKISDANLNRRRSTLEDACSLANRNFGTDLRPEELKFMLKLSGTELSKAVSGLARRVAGERLSETPAVAGMLQREFSIPLEQAKALAGQRGMKAMKKSIGALKKTCEDWSRWTGMNFDYRAFPEYLGMHFEVMPQKFSEYAKAVREGKEKLREFNPPKEAAPQKEAASGKSPHAEKRSAEKRQGMAKRHAGAVPREERKLSFEPDIKRPSERLKKLMEAIDNYAASGEFYIRGVNAGLASGCGSRELRALGSEYLRILREFEKRDPEWKDHPATIRTRNYLWKRADALAGLLGLRPKRPFEGV